jgi:hypothetical protein
MYEYIQYINYEYTTSRYSTRTVQYCTELKDKVAGVAEENGRMVCKTRAGKRFLFRLPTDDVGIF